VIQVAQENWRGVGIDTTIREIDAPAFPPTMAQGNFQIAYGSFGERHDPAFALWLGTNWQRYRNERALGLLRRALTTVRRDQRVSLVREFQAVAAEDMPVLMVAPRIFLNAAHKRLDGYAPTLSGSLWGAANWQVK
jgi:ABC-type transport system substrate-binding protein